MEHENFKVKDSTWSTAAYARETLYYKGNDCKSSSTGHNATPKELLSLAIDLKNRGTLN